MRTSGQISSVSKMSTCNNTLLTSSLPLSNAVPNSKSLGFGELAEKPYEHMSWQWVPDPSQEADWTDSNGTPFGEMEVLDIVDPIMIVGLYHYLALLRETETLRSLLSRLLESVRGLRSKAPSLYLRILLPLATQLLSSVQDSKIDDDEVTRRIYEDSRLLWQ
jgi:hypothetical protein